MLQKKSGRKKGEKFQSSILVRITALSSEFKKSVGYTHTYIGNLQKKKIIHFKKKFDIFGSGVRFGRHKLNLQHHI